MKRYVLIVSCGLFLAVTACFASIVIYSVVEVKSCKREALDVERVRKLVETDIMGIHDTPLTLIAICDSGEAPYLSTDLSSEFSVQLATKVLERRGWSVVIIDRMSNGHIWSGELRKKFQEEFIHLSINEGLSKKAYINVSIE